MLEAIDERRCLLHTGSNLLDEIAVYTGRFGFGFRVDEPPELIDHLRAPANRVNAAVTSEALPAQPAPRA